MEVRMARTRTCVRCRRVLSNGEADSPAALYTEHGVICERCVPGYKAALEAISEGSFAEDAGTDQPEAEPPGAVSEGDPEPEDEEPEPAGPETAEQADAIDLLERIRREVTQVRQALLYEKTSLWNVLGAVTQCFALAALVAALVRWGRDPQPLLTLAVLLQVMALTFFFQGK